jgi:hypothetical protein
MRRAAGRFSWRQNLRASTLSVIVGLGAEVLAPASLAYSHDHERPELKAWFQNLKSKSGAACCDDGEAEHAEAVWDMAKGGYKVFLKNPANPEESGKWFDVPAHAVVEQRNLNGVAMVWWSPFYSIDGTMTPVVRCFIPGAGG